MRVNNYTCLHTILLGMAILSGCIEPFYPELPDSGKSLVIEGVLTDREGNHQVRVSRSSSFDEPEYVPVPGCLVEVVDEDGYALVFHEVSPGLYEQWIPQDYLIYHRQYKLHVSWNGNSYESTFQELLPCAPVGDVYYEIESRETTDPDLTLQGIQFYTDLQVPEGYAENYRWELVETWEYRSTYYITWYWDGSQVLSPGSVNSDLYYCWNTLTIHQIFTGTIRQSTERSINGLRLNYVSNQSNRLNVKYSLLVRQYALGLEAYEYWKQLADLSQESGGLYETQPPQLRGNLRNTENEDEMVLGFFSVSGTDFKRVWATEDYKFYYTMKGCTPFFPLGGYPRNNPYYLVEVGRDSLWMASDFCFDCTLQGGTVVKPDFWE